MVTKVMLVTILCVKFSLQTEMVTILYFLPRTSGNTKAKTMLETECVSDKFELHVTI